MSPALARPLSARARFGAALATAAILFLASPGVLSKDGWSFLAFAALVPWALWCSRPGPKSFLVEWTAAGLGFCAMCAWSYFVWSGIFLFLFLVPGVYVALAGVVLRKLAPRWPLAVAAPAAWVALESARFLVPSPFAFGWMHLGTNLHADLWLAGSARVWGVSGLSWVAAAFAGAVADFLTARTSAERPPASRLWPSATLGLAPALAAAAISRLSAAPPTEDGPRVLLVQPSFEQHRKMQVANAIDLFQDSCDLTRQGLRDAASAGEPEPDLVAWGETMLPIGLVAPDLLDAWDKGVRPVPWARDMLDRRLIEGLQAQTDRWIGGVMFSKRAGTRARLLPPRTSLLAGAEYYGVRDGAIRRHNAAVLWDATGRQVGVAGKVHLVPGAEELCGLERLGWVRKIAESVAGYVPDLVSFDETQVLTLTAPERRSWRMGVTVCFDNAYEDPYTGPLRKGDLDFHVVLSNEAWYRESYEYDQMVAFSRLLAVSTGRALVRSTNAGITMVLGPDGRELARLTSGGRDRMVAGTLRAVVPVPVDAAHRTWFVRGEPVWRWLWLAIAACLCAWTWLSRLHTGTEALERDARMPAGRA